MSNPNDLEIGVVITDRGTTGVADKIRVAMAALRAELARGSAISPDFSATLDAIKTQAQLELNIVRDAVRDKVQTEDAGNRQRLEILRRYLEQVKSLTAAASPTPIAPTSASVPPSGGGGAPGGTSSPPRPPDDSTLATSANVAIGRFVELGRTIDVTNSRAVAGYRAQGDALAVNLSRLGATDTELNAIGAAVQKLERQSGAATLLPPGTPGELDNSRRRLIEFGNASDATFARVPRGARSAAAALTVFAFAAETGTASATSMVRASGNLAFGLSQLSTNANVVAGAAGIGAIITVGLTAIEVIRNLNTEAREGEKVLESFIQSDESFAARSKAAGEVISSLGGLPGSSASEIKLIGLTKRADDLRKAIVAAQQDASKGLPGLSFFERTLASEGASSPQTQRLFVFANQVRDLQKQFVSGGVTATQFKAQLDAIGTNHPDFAKVIAASRELVANLVALEDAERKETSAALQRRAVEEQQKATFGLTPDLARNLDETNRRLLALRTGGASGVAALQREMDVLKLARDAWAQYVLTQKDGNAAGKTFEQALGSQDKAVRDAAVSIQGAARQIVTTDAQIAATPQVIEARRRANQELLALEAERLRGEVAAQRQAIINELANTEASIQQNVALEGVRGDLIAKARQAANAKLDKIDRDQAKASLQLSADMAVKIAEAGTGSSQISTVDKATDEANKRRADRQRDINKITVGDAEATAFERAQLEEQAEAERDATITAARRQASQELAKITADSEAEILRLSGEATAARRRQIEQEATERAKAIGVQGGGPQALALNERRKQLELANVDVQDFETRSNDALKNLDTDIQRTQALTASGAISETEARQRVIDAYTRTRDVLGELIPQLEAVARATGNKEALATVAQLTTKYVEFGTTLSTLSDAFGKFKTAGRQGLEAGLTTFLENVPKLGTQDLAEVHALEGQLTNARTELDNLLKGPPTADATRRITELRGEISNTEINLQHAKDALESWRDLAVQAAGQVFDAIAKVAAQTIVSSALNAAGGLFRHAPDTTALGAEALSVSATQLSAAATATATAGATIGTGAGQLSAAGGTLVTGAGGLSGSAGQLTAAGGILNGAAAALAIAAQALAAAAASAATAGAISTGSSLVADGLDFEFAEGGAVPHVGRVYGPSGVDVIDAKLTADEFVHPPQSTRYYGFTIMEAIRRRMLPRGALEVLLHGTGPLSFARPSARAVQRYNDGGLVTVSPMAAGSTRAPGDAAALAGGPMRFHFTFHHDKRTILETLKSPDGAIAQIETIQQNANAISSLIK